MTLSDEVRMVRQYLGSVIHPFEGPDAERYRMMSAGTAVSMPFHLRWLLPQILKSQSSWWAVWWGSFPLAAVGMFFWAISDGMQWQHAAAAAVLLVALPGLTGVRPTEVSLPAMAVSTVAAACFAQGWWPAGIVIVMLASTIKESSAIWVAAWTLNPIALIGLVAPLVRMIVSKADPHDAVTDSVPVLQRVRDHPLVSSLEHHRGHWRSGWLLVAPFGACLAGLVRPSAAVVVTLVGVVAQLLLTTDLQRLMQTSAGPILALSAADVIPTEWLLLACVLHVVWWRDPVRL